VTDRDRPEAPGQRALGKIVDATHLTGRRRVLDKTDKYLPPGRGDLEPPQDPECSQRCPQTLGVPWPPGRVGEWFPQAGHPRAFHSQIVGHAGFHYELHLGRLTSIPTESERDNLYVPDPAE
jgi:hypothetical protein